MQLFFIAQENTDHHHVTQDPYSCMSLSQLYGEGSKQIETRACSLVVLMTEVR